MDGLPKQTEQETQTKEEEQTQQQDEISRFIQDTAARLRQQAAQLTEPETQQAQALEIAIAAWQLVRAICDSQHLAIVAKDGIICGLAKVAEERAPEEL